MFWAQKGSNQTGAMEPRSVFRCRARRLLRLSCSCRFCAQKPVLQSFRQKPRVISDSADEPALEIPGVVQTEKIKAADGDAFEIVQLGRSIFRRHGNIQ